MKKIIFSQYGRSMVEMLGVLAIIGVLSVGAISGYSKAMFKYKLNKHAEQMNTVINAISRNVHSFDNVLPSTNLTQTFIKMGEIPTEMVNSDENHYKNDIHDVFGQYWSIFITRNLIFLSTNGNSSFLDAKSTENLDICKNILTIAKENHSLIHALQTYSKSADTNDKMTHVLYGDDHCSASRTCLKNLTLDDIYTTCNEHYRNSYSVFEFMWHCDNDRS